MKKNTRAYLRALAQSLPWLAAALSMGSARAAATYPGRMAPLAQYLSTSVADEVALARSAAPAAISDKAQILTLGRHGYEVYAQGTNGFVCVVQRSWEGNFDNKDFWNSKVRSPMCYNPAAAHSLLPEYLERTRWVFGGMTAAQMAERAKFAPSATGAMAYMMSRQQVICSAAGCSRWYPHLMFFFPTDETPDWGTNQSGGPVFSGRYDPRTAVLFLLVPTWSDGTPSQAGDHDHDM
jgi:hypothetical protein